MGFSPFFHFCPFPLALAKIYYSKYDHSPYCKFLKIEKRAPHCWDTLLLLLLLLLLKFSVKKHHKYFLLKWLLRWPLHQLLHHQHLIWQCCMEG